MKAEQNDKGQWVVTVVVGTLAEVEAIAIAAGESVAPMGIKWREIEGGGE